MDYTIKILFCVCLFTGFACKHDSQKESSNSIDTSSEIHFLICTDPIAHSYHKDYSSSGSYCNGLKRCMQRGYEVIRLPEDEAISKRSDPCNFCYGH